MEVEILLDCDEVSPENHRLIEQKFMDWYQEGSEIRHNKMSFSSCRRMDEPNRYQVNFGYADPLEAIRNLHARVRHLGVKVFIHFLY